jgi:hypothetical protein
MLFPIAFTDRFEVRKLTSKGPCFEFFFSLKIIKNLKFDYDWFHFQNKKKEKGRRKRQYKYMKFDIKNKKEEPLFCVT